MYPINYAQANLQPFMDQITMEQQIIQDQQEQNYYEEQKQIANYLNEALDKLDIAISKAQQEIASIKEYREALITDLVTGKRSIPQIQSS